MAIIKPILWKLKSNPHLAILKKHPWARKEDLQNPQACRPGAPIELRDAQGNFVARGYGNLKSKISFRALSFDSRDENPWSKAFLVEKILSAWARKRELGFHQSFRLCFSEGDETPGLIVDYYRSGKGKDVQVLSVQILTAGMSEIILPAESFFKVLIESAFAKTLTPLDWASTAVVLRNDVRQRKFEGLEVEEPRFIKSVQGVEYTKFPVAVLAHDQSVISLEADLFMGQKTGFFLDQLRNIQLVTEYLQQNQWPASVRVLDLCCYVGHWSTQLTSQLKKQGCQVEVTLVDVSEQSLKYAQENAKNVGAQVVVEKRDVVKDFEQLNGEWDIIISDPPAFIKAAKDIPQGKHAYYKLNKRAFEKLKNNGLLIACSCSANLAHEDFDQVLKKAIAQSHVQAELVLTGELSLDHTHSSYFREGNYLKMRSYRKLS